VTIGEYCAVINLDNMHSQTTYLCLSTSEYKVSSSTLMPLNEAGIDRMAGSILRRHVHPNNSPEEQTT
jgi:hypothetical protein